MTARLVHSHGPDNKNPDYDLGGQPSKFSIATNPKNNLFADVTPTEANEGMIDWRCFYLFNEQANTVVKDVKFTVTNTMSCAQICLGTRLANDIQQITFCGTAQQGGIVVLATEFGGPFTCEYTGNWITFASEIQEKIRLTRWCDQVTVSYMGTCPGGGAKYNVEFKGDVRNRLVSPIILVQNSLASIQGPEYRIAAWGTSDPFNGSGDATIKVVWPIADAPSDGWLWVFNPNISAYVKLSYTSWASDMFDMAANLAFNLTPGDELWVEGISQISCTVNITKEQDGWPIGQFAEILDLKTDIPSITNCTTELTVGMLLPNESCYVWAKRSTSGCGCKSGFSLQVEGTDETLRSLSITEAVQPSITTVQPPEKIEVIPVVNDFNKVIKI